MNFFILLIQVVRIISIKKSQKEKKIYHFDLNVYYMTK